MEKSYVSFYTVHVYDLRNRTTIYSPVSLGNISYWRGDHYLLEDCFVRHYSAKYVRAKNLSFCSDQIVNYYTTEIVAYEIPFPPEELVKIFKRVKPEETT